MAAASASAESAMKMSSNASSTLCNLSGSSRRPLPVRPVSHSQRRRKANSSAARVQALSSSFFGSVRLRPTAAAPTLQQKQQTNNLSVFAMAAAAISQSRKTKGYGLRNDRKAYNCVLGQMHHGTPGSMFS